MDGGYKIDFGRSLLVYTFCGLLVLVNEIKRVINVKLEIWRDILECKGYIKWE